MADIYGKGNAAEILAHIGLQDDASRWVSDLVLELQKASDVLGTSFGSEWDGSKWRDFIDYKGPDFMADLIEMMV